MIKAVWNALVLWILISTCTVVYAGAYTSPTLEEASLLLDISPKEAQSLTSAYLTKRTLSDTNEKTPSKITSENADNLIRTPNSSVEALEILAQALFRQGYYDESLRYLKSAIALTKQYQLPYLEIEVRQLEIRLNWILNHDAQLARQQLSHLSDTLAKLKNSEQLGKGIRYKTLMLLAEIASKSNDTDLAESRYEQAKAYITTTQSVKRPIEYHIQVGQHYLNHKRYNKALSELLTAYWSALESNDGALLAMTNSLLAQLFYERKVLDKALLYLAQAADFYDSYEESPVLVDILKRMGDIYSQQSKFNLALVYYLNVLDHSVTQHNMQLFIAVRIRLASTYMQLYNYPLAEDYLSAVEPLLEQFDFPQLKGQALLLKAGIAFYQKKPVQAIKLALQSTELAKSTQDNQTLMQAFTLLSEASEQQGHYLEALNYSRQYNQLSQALQNQLNHISEEAFKQQKTFVEQTLHLAGQDRALQQQEKRYRDLQNIAYGLFTAGFIFFLLILRRGYVIRKQSEEIEYLNNHLFTHSRSHLNNLRMLNEDLSSSLQKSSHTYEQWHIGELIHEPLSDRLRFAMIDIPFLRNMYLQHGYTEGLKLELAFGEYLQDKLDEHTRLFHFTDANLIYVENNYLQDDSAGDTSPQALFEKIQEWVNEFQPSSQLNRIIRIGIADYPFLPKAYTAISEKELLDILLMATSASRELSISEETSHWVYLKAIDNAPAASFASDNIRQACQQAISQGLIKVHSSHKNEESMKNLLKDT
ncbi:tetratricopeptide repeat protein [Vibrio mangrovi]|uniref:Tetratricopeptide repeat protein n=1 Tax=Vibrio mangrovi TaxID=474394 RepID=A0A1Y6IQC3_9VIBR|nr:tetratricopeptide repeat protein [Vibrio mangrovi]MDW6003376.1 tetratricopeptide repeat protein [Vibrio mangrovi]SMR99834.1 Tetratricopeptide repeat protein [Vibrio mangrovi]